MKYKKQFIDILNYLIYPNNENLLNQMLFPDYD